MAYFKVELITPEQRVLREEADQVTLPTPDGEITLLPHHIPLVTIVSAGEVRLKRGNEEIPLAVSQGFLEVDGQTIRLLVDTAERVEEIDEQRAEEARQRAAQAMQEQQRMGEEDYARVAAKLERELARLRVARKYRHRRHDQPASPAE